MALETVKLALSAQSSASGNLMSALRNGQQVTARLQGMSKSSSGETVLHLNISGQSVDVRATPDVAAKLTTGSMVTLQLGQGDQAGQLTIQLAQGGVTTSNSAAEGTHSLASQLSAGGQGGTAPTEQRETSPAVLVKIDSSVAQQSSAKSSTALTSAQTTTASSLAQSMSNGQQVPATLQGQTPLPSGNVALQMDVGGQALTMTVTAKVASGLTTGGAVTLQHIDTAQGPQLTVQPAQSGAASAPTAAIPNIQQSVSQPTVQSVPSTATGSGTASQPSTSASIATISSGSIGALGLGQQVTAQVQSNISLPSGEALVRLNLSGQSVELRAPVDLAARLPEGSLVTLQRPEAGQVTSQATAQVSNTSTNQSAGQGTQLIVQPLQTNLTNASGAGLPQQTQTSSPPIAQLPQSSQTGSIANAAGTTASPNQQMSEASLAFSTSSPTQTSSAQAAAPLSANQLTDALVALQRQAMGQQRSLTDLFANLSAVLDQIETGQRPNISQDVEMAMRWVLGFQMPALRSTGNDKAGDSLRQIFASMGLFVGGAEAGGEQLLTSNFKASLSLLRVLLEQEADLPDFPLPAMARRDPPPLNGSKLFGQPPQAADIFLSDSDEAALTRIRNDVEAALARATLTQLASLRSSHTSHTGAHAFQTLHAEIPIPMADGTAVIQMTVQQGADPFDGGSDSDGEGNKSGKNKAWTANFALDAEPIGKVDASIRVVNDRVNVSLQAEKAETRSIFEESGPALREMLEQEGLVLENLSIDDKADNNSPSLVDSVPAYNARLDRTL